MPGFSRSRNPSISIVSPGVLSPNIPAFCQVNRIHYHATPAVLYTLSVHLYTMLSGDEEFVAQKLEIPLNVLRSFPVDQLKNLRRVYANPPHVLSRAVRQYSAKEMSSFLSSNGVSVSALNLHFSVLENCLVKRLPHWSLSSTERYALLAALSRYHALVLFILFSCFQKRCDQNRICASIFDVVVSAREMPLS